jgi:hypothetical protein
MDEQNPQVAGPGQPGYGPGPQPSTLAPDPAFDGPKTDAERELHRSALLTGTRAEYAAAVRQIMAARNSVAAEPEAARAAAAPAAPAASTTPPSPILEAGTRTLGAGGDVALSELHKTLASAAAGFAAMGEAEREAAIDAGEAHVLKTLFRGNEHAMKRAVGEIKAAAGALGIDTRQVDESRALASPRAFNRAWLLARTINSKT